MYSVIIHHAVSGCFACRKIICFNLPGFQTHTEHHILCKKVLWVAPSSSPLQYLFCWKGFFFFVFPTPSLTKSILGIPFQKIILKYFCLKGEILATHCFSLYPAATQRSLFPPVHTHASVHHCLSPVLQKSNQQDADLSIPSHMNDSPWMAPRIGFFLFVFQSISTGHRACVVEKNSVLQQHSGSFHH